MTERFENGITDKAVTGGLSAVDHIIERFGGLRPMADKLGVPVSTVQGWKKRAAIPALRGSEVRSAADRHGITLTNEEIDAALRHDEGTERTAAEDVPAASPAPAVTVTPPEAAVSEPDNAAAPAAASSAAPSADESAHAEQAAPSAADAPSPAPSAASPRTEPPPSARQPISSRGVAGLAVAAMAVSFIAGALAVTVPMWSSDFAAAGAKVVSLDEKLGQIEKRIGLAPSTAPMAERIAAVEAAVLEVERKLTTLPGAVGLIAVRDLRFLLDNGMPFALESAAVSATEILTPDAVDALASVLPYATSGIPTHDEVATSFTWTSASVARSELASFDAGYGDRVLGWLGGVAGVVQVAATGNTRYTGTASRLALAGALIDKGELAGAVRVVSQITGPGAGELKPWLAQARARLAADAVSAKLASYLTAATRP